MKLNQTLKICLIAFVLLLVFSVVAQPVLVQPGPTLHGTRQYGTSIAQTASRDVYLDDIPATSTYVINTDGTNIWATKYDGKVEFSGTDASTVIQSAIDNLAGVGGKIFIKRGLYIITDTINMTDRFPIWLCGEGQGAMVFQQMTCLRLGDNANKDMINIAPTGSTLFHRISDMLLDGNKENNIAGSGIVNTINSQDLKIDHVYICFFAEHGLKISRAWGLRIYGCPIENNGGDGIHSTGGSEASIIGSYFDHNSGYGIYAVGAYRWDIVGTSVYRSGLHGMWLNGQEFVINGGRVIANSQSNAGAYDGIFLGVGSDRSIIADVIFDGQFADVNHQRYGVNIPYTGTEDVRIDNCVFVNQVTGDVNDGGTRTRINGLGREAAGIGGTPTAENWDVGDMVRNIDDDTVWIKDYTGAMRRLG